MTAITFPSKPGLYHLHHKQLVKNNFIWITNAGLLAYDVDGKMLGLDEMGLLECVFAFLTNLFTESTVHICNMFTHRKIITNCLLKQQFPFYSIYIYIYTHIHRASKW